MKYLLDIAELHENKSYKHVLLSNKDFETVLEYLEKLRDERIAHAGEGYPDELVEFIYRLENAQRVLS